MSRIGAAIKAERLACGMSIEQVAEATDVPAWEIEMIEEGRHVPRHRETVLRFTNAFPDVDTAAWFWHVVTDLWGEPIADVMRRHAVAPARPEPREEP